MGDLHTHLHLILSILAILVGVSGGLVPRKKRKSLRTACDAIAFSLALVGGFILGISVWMIAMLIVTSFVSGRIAAFLCDFLMSRSQPPDTGSPLEDRD